MHLLNRTHTDKDSFYNTLDSVLRNVPPHDELIILGDFNATTGSNRDMYEDVIGLFGSRSGSLNDQCKKNLSV